MKHKNTYFITISPHVAGRSVLNLDTPKYLQKSILYMGKSKLRSTAADVLEIEMIIFTCSCCGCCGRSCHGWGSCCCSCSCCSGCQHWCAGAWVGGHGPVGRPIGLHTGCSVVGPYNHTNSQFLLAVDITLNVLHASLADSLGSIQPRFQCCAIIIHTKYGHHYM